MAIFESWEFVGQAATGSRAAQFLAKMAAGVELTRKIAGQLEIGRTQNFALR